MTAPISRNPDVIVVGAGAAGLSAAKALKGRGFEVVVLEAADHVGGRCMTDASRFSTPFDRGGSWLHSAAINPLARLAEDHGETLHKAPWSWNWVLAGGEALGPEEVADYRRYHEDMWTSIREAGAKPGDMPIEAALPASRWRGVAKHWVAQMQGGDADVTSVVDVHRYADDEGDWLVEGGLGAFLKRLHADVPVLLSSPVTKIDYAGAGVRATTPRGEISARFLVLTVSTGVLAAETIEFAPGLPNETLTAIGRLPTGLLNKVGIEFDPGWTAAHQGQIADYAPGDNAFCTLLFGFYDGPLSVGFLAGRFADEVEREGAGAATDFCMQALKGVFGTDIGQHILRTDETSWRANPHTRGAYSYALTGGADHRAILAQPIENKIFIAGEATMPNAYATVHGAYLSGLSVSEKILAECGDDSVSR